ncbi:hypothetical protein GCM10011409_32310 [Lentibacillus populi]|uniref:Uncharacterized protein n=1 Tax=Lentibacillus populi TaxID=1827502 RepID=A0A9W5TZQ5_9BACI|nr:MULTISPECIES: hypothetical protein [Bacillaceae]GGB52296.1 hypothetical protein GCM10011409_32310 [Lentibacillus populi]
MYKTVSDKSLIIGNMEGVSIDIYLHMLYLNMKAIKFVDENEYA